MTRLFGAVVCAALTAIQGTIAFGQDVELTSFDGTVALEGNLLAFDGTYYQLDTIYGPITVSAEGVNCAGPGCPDLTTFVAEARIAGEATLIETLLPGLLAGFADAEGLRLAETTAVSDGLIFVLERPSGVAAAHIVVTPGTSETGFLALLAGDTDLALTLRPPSADEHAASQEATPDDPPLDRRVRVLALDALTPIVAAQNPVSSMSLPDLASVFAGEITNWSEFDGPDAPIALHMLNPHLGLAQAFTNELLLPSGRTPSASIIRHATQGSLAEAVENDAYAIGITAQSARAGTQALAISGACGFAQTADANAVKAEDYPLTAPVYLYLAPRRLPQLVRDFLAFTETEAAERIVAQSGFVNQALTRTPLAMQGVRLANAISAAGPEVELETLQRLVSRLSSAERLSATFRFANGSSELDAQSRASIARLTAAIERGAFDGRTLLFVGFSDGAGSAEVNERLSLRRAETVRDAVLAAASAVDPSRLQTEVDAFGEAMPMACDNGSWGSHVNRRVEVWID